MNDIKNYTLNGISTMKRDRNPLNGRFNKGCTHHNKGKKGVIANSEDARANIFDALRRGHETYSRLCRLGLIKRPDITENRSREVGYIDNRNTPHVFTNVRVASEWIVANGFSKSPNVKRIIHRSCSTTNRTAYGFKWYFTDSDEFLEKLKEAYR